MTFKWIRTCREIFNRAPLNPHYSLWLTSPVIFKDSAIVLYNLSWFIGEQKHIYLEEHLEMAASDKAHI